MADATRARNGTQVEDDGVWEEPHLGSCFGAARIAPGPVGSQPIGAGASSLHQCNYGDFPGDWCTGLEQWTSRSQSSMTGESSFGLGPRCRACLAQRRGYIATWRCCSSGYVYSFCRPFAIIFTLSCVLSESSPSLLFRKRLWGNVGDKISFITNLHTKFEEAFWENEHLGPTMECLRN